MSRIDCKQYYQTQKKKKKKKKKKQELTKWMKDQEEGSL
jgi:hypothetical protein